MKHPLHYEALNAIKCSAVGEGRGRDYTDRLRGGTDELAAERN